MRDLPIPEKVWLYFAFTIVPALKNYRKKVTACEIVKGLKRFFNQASEQIAIVTLTTKVKLIYKNTKNKSLFNFLILFQLLLLFSSKSWHFLFKKK